MIAVRRTPLQLRIDNERSNEDKVSNGHSYAAEVSQGLKMYCRRFTQCKLHYVA